MRALGADGFAAVLEQDAEQRAELLQQVAVVRPRAVTLHTLQDLGQQLFELKEGRSNRFLEFNYCTYSLFKSSAHYLKHYHPI